jgi:hypothetical protein
VHHVAAVVERGAQDAVALEAHVPAQPRTLEALALQGGDPLEERLGLRPLAGLAPAHQRLEGVAAQQLVVEFGVLRRPRDEVAAHDP